MNRRNWFAAVSSFLAAICFGKRQASFPALATMQQAYHCVSSGPVTIEYQGQRFRVDSVHWKTEICGDFGQRFVVTYSGTIKP